MKRVLFWGEGGGCGSNLVPRALFPFPDVGRALPTPEGKSALGRGWGREEGVWKGRVPRSVNPLLSRVIGM